MGSGRDQDITNMTDMLFVILCFVLFGKDTRTVINTFKLFKHYQEHRLRDDNIWDGPYIYKYIFHSTSDSVFRTISLGPSIINKYKVNDP